MRPWGLYTYTTYIILKLKNMKLKTIYQISAILAVILLVGYLMTKIWDKRPTPDVPYYEKPGFKTDTIIVNDTLYLPVPYPVKVPPKVVIEYHPVPDSGLILRYDSLLSVIDTLGKKPKVDINPKFLTQYPNASKLIAGSFTEDTLSLSLLNTKGQIYTEIYLIDYKSFNYHYIHNSISTIRKSTSTIPKSARKYPFISYDGVYLEYNQDFVNSTKGLGTDVGITILNKIRLKGYGELWLNGVRPNSLGIKVGYRLF